MSLAIYPIGKPHLSTSYDPLVCSQHIQTLAALPANLTDTILPLSDAQQDTPIRPDAWTIRQLVHHITDSHLNAYVRFRLGLTEDNPTIKGYDEMSWAYALPDAKSGPVSLSLPLLSALHTRWVALLEHIPDDQWIRTIQNPESGSWSLWQLLVYYAWHGDHHLAQIKQRLETPYP